MFCVSVLLDILQYRDNLSCIGWTGLFVDEQKHDRVCRNWLLRLKTTASALIISVSDEMPISISG